MNATKLSILLIAPQPFFVNRGTPINVRAIAESLASAGYKVDLLVFPQGQDISIPNVTIHRAFNFLGLREVPIGPSWRKIALDIGLTFSAFRLALNQRYAVIHGVEEGAFIAGMLAKITSTKWIFDMDSCMSTQLQDSGFLNCRPLLWLFSKFEQFCLRRASAILTVCGSLSDKAKTIAPNVRIKQIEDFPLEGATTAPEQRVKQLTSQLNPNQRPILLYTGNLETYQGIDLLIRSFALSMKRAEYRAINPLLLIVGGEDRQVSHYKELCRQLEIESNVCFTGPQPASDMGSYMSMASVLISPRLHGSNTPLKIYTYMAAAKPIVATSIVSHTQVLSNESAYLAAPTVDEFSLALCAALETNSAAVTARQNRTAAALKLIESRYNRRIFAEAIADLYSELIANSPRKPSGEIK